MLLYLVIHNFSRSLDQQNYGSVCFEERKLDSKSGSFYGFKVLPEVASSFDQHGVFCGFYQNWKEQIQWSVATSSRIPCCRKWPLFTDHKCIHLQQKFLLENEQQSKLPLLQSILKKWALFLVSARLFSDFLLCQHFLNNYLFLT